jgi:hypothetical protein
MTWSVYVPPFSITAEGDFLPQISRKPDLTG